MRYFYLILVQLMFCAGLTAQVDYIEIDSSAQGLQLICSEDIELMPIQTVDMILSEHLGVMIRPEVINIRGHEAPEIVYFVDGVESYIGYYDRNDDLKTDIRDVVMLINEIYHDFDDSDSSYNGFAEKCEISEIDEILDYLYSDEDHSRDE